MNFLTGIGVTGIIFLIFVIFGFFAMVAKFYRKVEQGQALVRNGIGGTKVSFSGSIVVPILHMAEVMDISVERVIIDRQGGEGLICKDNIRADIKVVFFVRVNKTEEDVLKVAQSVGCKRASDPKSLQELFDAKFSEALKTVGKHFNFSDLYTSRDQFKEEILKVIGTDLNGFVMDDAAIDFLEQTPITKLDPDNIMDSEGIKRITELTSDQKILANQIDREREKKVAITQAEKSAEEALVIDVKAAQASRQVAEFKADEDMIKTLKAAEAAKKAADFRAEQIAVEAEAYQNKAQKESAAKKMLAEAMTAEKAAPGLADVQVLEARAIAIEKEGTAKAKVESLHYQAEAKGIEGKANAMKLLDAVGKNHEEFKLELEKTKAVELAEMEIRREVAKYQADVLAQALKSAKIDIIGGESVFFDKVVNAVIAGKTVDRFVSSSKTLSDVKETFFNSDPEFFKSQIRRFVSQFGLNAEDVKNLSVSALLGKMVGMAQNPEDKGMLYELLAIAERSGITKKSTVPKEGGKEVAKE